MKRSQLDKEETPPPWHLAECVNDSWVLIGAIEEQRVDFNELMSGLL